MPPNGATSEVEAIGAAWHAKVEFDPSRGCPLAGFVLVRIRHHVLARYRHEWSYALHCPVAFSEGFDVAQSTHSNFADVESLNTTLMALTAQDRRLITLLFLEGRTEAEIAKAWGISQQAVSKRKCRVFRYLRRELRKK